VFVNFTYFVVLGIDGVLHSEAVAVVRPVSFLRLWIRLDGGRLTGSESEYSIDKPGLGVSNMWEIFAPAHKSRSTVRAELCDSEGFQTAKVTFKVIQRHCQFGNGTIRQATCDFLLVCHCNYVLHRFRDIISYFQKLKEVT